MRVVLDASGAAQIIAKTSVGIDFYDTIVNADMVLAPDLYVSEVMNIAWKFGRKYKENIDVFRQDASNCIGFIDIFVPAIDLWQEALSIAQEYDHSAYDMLYVALAKRNGAVLITMDEKLRLVCEKLSIRTRESYE